MVFFPRGTGCPIELTLVWFRHLKITMRMKVTSQTDQKIRVHENLFLPFHNSVGAVQNLHLTSLH